MSELTSTRPRPVVLCILDGWGSRSAADDNAISLAHTPHYDQLLQRAPHAHLRTSADDVGLPAGQMGNSEVGHQNIGAGRIVLQDLPRIDKAVTDGALADRPELRDFIAKLKATGGRCHLMGLLSPGGVHAHETHILALAKCLSDAGIAVCLHAFLDGRDTPPKSGLASIRHANNALADLPGATLATVCGRYHAMDRDKRWDRVSRAYDLLVDGDGGHADDAVAAVEASYAADITDEFVEPVAIGGYSGMRDGDGLLMANFRADRAREILTALLDPNFDGFDRKRRASFAAALGMVSYSDALDTLLPALFPPSRLTNTLGEVVSNAGMTQLRIAETEKYAHVTFFLNGGEERTFQGEERILVPSPKVATYDLQPEMSAHDVTRELSGAIREQRFDLIVVNYANPDMVGHTGNIPAAIKAVETIDGCLGELLSAVESVGGVMLITADHGNIEQMRDPANGGPHTAHTINLVPAILANAPAGVSLRDGRLADIAPTLLQLMGLQAPSEMTGHSLLQATRQRAEQDQRASA